MLRRLYAEKLSSSERATLQPLEWLHVVADAIAAVLSSVRWIKIFKKLAFSGSSQEWRRRSAANWVLTLCQSSDPLFPPSPKCDRFFPNTAVWMCGPAYRGRAQGVTQKVGSSARWIETENRVEAHYTFVLAETAEVL